MRVWSLPSVHCVIPIHPHGIKKLIEDSVTGESCICRACEKHVKRNRIQTLLGMQETNILPEYMHGKMHGSVIHSGLVAPQQILVSQASHIFTSGGKKYVW